MGTVAPMAKVLCHSEQNALTRRVLIFPAVGPDSEEAVLENTVNAGSCRTGKPNRLAVHPFCTVCDGAEQALARAGGLGRRHGECPFHVPTQQREHHQILGPSLAGGRAV